MATHGNGCSPPLSEPPLPLSFLVGSQSGADIQPFEVELLSDVEGASEKRRPSPRGIGGGDGGEVLLTEDDAWMRNIWGVENRAVVMSYFCVGFAIRFLTTPISYYTVNVLGEALFGTGRVYPG